MFMNVLHSNEIKSGWNIDLHNDIYYHTYFLLVLKSYLFLNITLYYLNILGLFYNIS